MLTLLAIPYTTPRLARLRVARAPWDKTDLGETQSARASPASVPTLGQTTLPPSTNEATVTNALPEVPMLAQASAANIAKGKGSLAIDDPSGHALDAFYDRLDRTKRKDPGAITRM